MIQLKNGAWVAARHVAWIESRPSDSAKGRWDVVLYLAGSLAEPSHFQRFETQAEAEEYRDELARKVEAE